MWSRLSPSALAPGSHTLHTGPHPKTEVQYAPVLGALLAPESYEVARAFFPWIYRASTSRRRSAGFPDYRYWPLIESCPYRRRDLRTPPHRAHPLPGWCRRWLRRFPAPGCWIRAAAALPWRRHSSHDCLRRMRRSLLSLACMLLAVWSRRCHCCGLLVSGSAGGPLGVTGPLWATSADIYV